MAIIHEAGVPKPGVVELPSSYEPLAFIPRRLHNQLDMNRRFRIALVGKDTFGKDAFNRIAAEHDVVDVYAPMDVKDKGTGEVKKVDVLKAAARQAKADGMDLNVHTLSVLDDPDLPEAMDKKKGIDLLLMALVTKTIKQPVLFAAKFNALNYHPSLLIESIGRGPASIPREIKNGAKETGVAIYEPDEGLDTGRVLLNPRAPIFPHDTPFTLDARLQPIGVGALSDGVRLLASGAAEWTYQGEGKYEGPIEKWETQFDWNLPGWKVYDMGRGFVHMSPFTELDPFGIDKTFSASVLLEKGSIVNLSDIALTDEKYDSTPGELVDISGRGGTVATGSHAVVFRTAQISAIANDAEGKLVEDRSKRGKKLPFLDFANDYGIRPGMKFSSVTRS